MTSDIMHSILTKLNAQMKAQGRNILLFIDGAGCHPSDLTLPVRRVGRGVSSLPGNPPFRLFSGRGSSSGAFAHATLRALYV